MMTSESELLRRERKKLTAKLWRLKNKESVKESNRKYKLKNKEKIKQQRALYISKNREQYLLRAAQYRKKGKLKVLAGLPILPQYSHSLKHGHTRNYSRTKVYAAWEKVIKRNSDRDCIYKPWVFAFNKDAFVNFLNDVGEPPHPKSKLCRIDKKLGVKPDNVFWTN